ncbi:MAG: transporter substrate-binding protein [Limimaricola sp.]|uniref:transporter substrate-binding protein n=1 Tax=Limimaricola sp. TaxID=2211665 RepID=UPI001DE84DC0|nr:transporter substrate-binding protein [Limimaricola sp.]MBI1416020.1 transporter substrate-binding protein [Limimaricola sp.]
MKTRIEIGLLYSRSGSYALIGEACRTGALAAMDEINADPAQPFTLVPVERDPGGNIDLYAPMCEDILRGSGARHVIGCVTSWSRKEVIPVLERMGGTLWYAVPYEGFEASDHVAYTHACPNQHLLPLLDWAMPAYGRRAYLVGSNYIWGWEMNRLARARVAAAGGEVLGERYLPIGDTDVARMIDEIRATRPAFIHNALIGPSSYAFMAAMRRLADEDARFAPDRCPVLSCNMTECELPAMGDDAAGLIAAGPYFRGAGGWPGRDGFGSSHEAAAHAAVHQLAGLLAGAPARASAPLADLLQAPLPAGCAIDPQTHHTTLPVLIAQVKDGAFRVLSRQAAVAGDPYLAQDRGQPRPALRVVS